MIRIMIGAAFACALLGSSALAAGPSAPSSMTPTTAPSSTPPAAPKMDLAGECKELGTQWEAAETANATNAKLGKAKAKAKAAEKNCASTKASKERTGISQYKAALKVLGVKPTT